MTRHITALIVQFQLIIIISLVNSHVKVDRIVHASLIPEVVTNSLNAFSGELSKDLVVLDNFLIVYLKVVFMRVLRDVEVDRHKVTICQPMSICGCQ